MSFRRSQLSALDTTPRRRSRPPCSHPPALARPATVPPCRLSSRRHPGEHAYRQPPRPRPTARLLTTKPTTHTTSVLSALTCISLARTSLSVERTDRSHSRARAHAPLVNGLRRGQGRSALLRRPSPHRPSRKRAAACHSREARCQGRGSCRRRWTRLPRSQTAEGR